MFDMQLAGIFIRTTISHASPYMKMQGPGTLSCCKSVDRSYFGLVENQGCFNGLIIKHSKFEMDTGPNGDTGRRCAAKRARLLEYRKRCEVAWDESTTWGKVKEGHWGFGTECLPAGERCVGGDDTGSAGGESASRLR